MSKPRYILISSDYSDGVPLTEKVNKKIEEGYIPCGGVIITVTANIYIQAMWLPEPDRKIDPTPPK
jgi:hypothetical protein